MRPRRSRAAEGSAMDFGALPPEINSARMYAGPGSGSMLAAAPAWNGLAAELHSAASSYGSVISELTDESWVGPSSTAMAAAAAPYVAWMSATAGQAEQAASSGQGGGGRLSGGVRDDGAAAGDRGQPHSAGVAHRDQHFRPEHPGDRGYRGPIRRNVGPGRRGDVRLCRELGGRLDGDAVHRGAADHQPGRVGRAGGRGCPGRRHVDWHGRAVDAVAAGLHGSHDATEPRVAQSSTSSTSSTSGLSGHPECAGLGGSSSTSSTSTTGPARRAFVHVVRFLARKPRDGLIAEYAYLPGFFSMFVATRRARAPYVVRR